MLLARLAVAFLLPRPFYSKVTLEVRPEYPPGGSLFIASQMEVLRKSEILEPVVNNLGLEKALSGGERPVSLPEATARLNRILDVREVRNTSLIELGVYHRDAQMAADIANGIAVVYKEKRLCDLQNAFNRGLLSLNESVEKERKSVEDARADMDRLRERDHVVDPDPEKFNGDPKVVTAYVEAKSRYLQSKRWLEGDELRHSRAREFYRNIDLDTVKIWEKAEPALERAPFRLRRFW